MVLPVILNASLLETTGSLVTARVVSDARTDGGRQSKWAPRRSPTFLVVPSDPDLRPLFVAPGYGEDGGIHDYRSLVRPLRHCSGAGPRECQTIRLRVHGEETPDIYFRNRPPPCPWSCFLYFCIQSVVHTTYRYFVRHRLDHMYQWGCARITLSTRHF